MRPLVFALALLAPGRCAVAGSDSVPREAVDRAITLAAQYIVHACDPAGKFIYEIDASTGKISPDYNIVRHAGAMYALAMFRGNRKDDQVTTALTHAGDYLRANYLRPGPIFQDAETLAVWSSPLHESGATKATLGASGLGLIGLLGVENIPPNELAALGRFLLFMQKPDGSFNSKYLAEDGGKFTEWGSLYYPGEAALALVSLHEATGDKRWLAAGEAVLCYLARSRAGKITVPADHWALIATAKLFAIGKPTQRDLLVAHAAQICESMLSEQITDSSFKALDGGFTRDGRTTPTSTRLEGLLSALEFLPPDRRELRARIEAAVHRGIRFLLPAQIQNGRYAGGIPRATSKSSEIRIDYVQHFLSATLRYRAFSDRAEATLRPQNATKL